MIQEKISSRKIVNGKNMTKPFNLEPQAGEKIWITGDTVIIRATAAETGGAYTMIEAIASLNFLFSFCMLFSYTFLKKQITSVIVWHFASALQ